MTKKLLCIILTVFMALNINAEREDKKFNPQQFKSEQEAFITREAKLSKQEAAAFFPLFNEMQDKQRALFNKQRNLARQKPTNDKEAAKQISEMDNIDMQIAKLRSQYHNKFSQAIPAMKVKLCIRAEERFKRQMMDRLMHASQKKGTPPNGPKKK